MSADPFKSVVPAQFDEYDTECGVSCGRAS